MKRIVFFLAVLGVLVPLTASAEYISVKVPVANIRSGPSETSEILWKVEAYYPMQVLGKKGDWYHFKDFQGDEGWINAKLVNKARSVITKEDNCNVRSGPGAKYDVVFTTDVGVPFKVLKQKGDWLHVLYTDGDRGWIYKSLVWPDQP